MQGPRTTTSVNMYKEMSERRLYAVKVYASATTVHLISLWPWPLTLKTFSAISTHMMNICGKFHWNPSTKWRYQKHTEYVLADNERKVGWTTREHNASGRLLLAAPSKCMPPPLWVNSSGHILDLWPLTLETFSANQPATQGQLSLPSLQGR